MSRNRLHLLPCPQTPEICLLDRVGRHHLFRRAGRADGAGLEQIGAVDHLQHLLHVLLDDQHREPAGADALHQFEHLLHHDRRQPRRRLVEQQQFRVRHQRAADRAHLLLAARHGAGHLAAPLLHARKQIEHEFQPLGIFGARARHVGAHLQIVVDGQPRKQPAVFRHMGDAEIDDAMRRRRQHVGAFHRDRASGRPDQAGDHAHQRGLAGAVGADHADRLARLDLEVDAEQRLEGAVARVDRFQFEHALRPPPCGALPRPQPGSNPHRCRDRPRSPWDRRPPRSAGLPKSSRRDRAPSRGRPRASARP